MENDAILADDSKATSASPGNTRADFHILLDRLNKESGRGAERYEELRLRLINFFRWNSCFPAEELADETLDRVARKIRRENILDIHSFAYGVAKNVRLEWRRRGAKTISFDDLPEAGINLIGSRTPHDVVQQKLLFAMRLRCLKGCIERLPTCDRDALTAYYGPSSDQASQRQNLATALGISIGALRVRMNRVRAKMEACILRCTSGSAKLIGTSKGQQ